MSLNRTSPRTDLDYLRRRPKPGESVVRVPAASSLTLPGIATPRSGSARQTPAARRVRRVAQRTVLSTESPVATLDRRQSAIGSLVVDVRPAASLGCVWELVDGTAGIVAESTGVRSGPVFAKRAIVELRKAQLIVGLRHVMRLRRLLVIVQTTSSDSPPASVVMVLHSGATIESTYGGTGTAVVAMAVYHVGGELVVRRESGDFPTLDAAADAYGFAATWTPPPVRPE